MAVTNMSANILSSLSMAKYARLLPRIFSGATSLQMCTKSGERVWQWCADNGTPADDATDAPDADPIAVWADHAAGIGRRQLPGGLVQYRGALRTRAYGEVGWLIVEFRTQSSVPMSTAPALLSRAFAEATAFLQEEIELQSECNQLAIELSERYEELNLVYSTQDQVEFFEEGQEALVRLVHNCADYLDVGMAALICRDRNLSLHSINSHKAPPDTDQVLELLTTSVYDRVESQVQSVVLNESDARQRCSIFGDRSENLVAYPVIDDHGTAIGLLAVVARQDLHTFSNGDRNLLEVMAKKASRIIHTHHDSLTGLMNRSGFESSLMATLASTRNTTSQHCLLHIDIDQLHVVNDLMGSQEGDNLIRRVAKTLRSTLRDSDCLARLGGDEFGVIVSNCDINQGHAVADKIRNAIHDLTVVSARRQLDVSASIGVASITQDTEGIVAVMASTEIACKAAKDDGRDRIQVFEEDNTTLIRRSEEIEWIGRVQQALRDDEFELYCQPVMPLLEPDDAAHFEILVRLRDEDGEILSPAVFLPAAERYQLMPMLDRWVVHNTMQALASCWAEISFGKPVFCINLSGQSLTNNGFQAFVTDELKQSAIPPENICFEITETAAISNIDDATSFMSALKSYGCRFSLDDFGAGLSSFGYLKVLPVDYLKIDGSFVREVTTDDVSLSMVKAICEIGRAMSLATVAEFVGDQETMDILKPIGVDYVQGYYVGKPVPVDEIFERLRSRDDAASA